MKTPSRNWPPPLPHTALFTAHPGASRRTGRLHHCLRRTPLPRRATTRPDRDRGHRRYRPRGRTGDLRPRAFGEHSARGNAAARRGRSLQSRHADPPRRCRRRGRTLRQERAVYLLPDETRRTDPRHQKTFTRKLYYIGSRYGVGTIRKRLAKDDLQRPPQKRGGVAEILCKGVQANGGRPLYERSGPVSLRPDGVCRMQVQRKYLRYVRYGGRTMHEPGMPRSQEPQVHRAKKRRTARAKPEIHPLQRPLRMRRP